MLSTYKTNGLTFSMLMYSDHFQIWLGFVIDLLIFPNFHAILYKSLG